ncbi:class E sortase [Candidatus Saccharibacteria bacterium]|nr:class E sortase [Candidatus Saccharibacteria bacterium]
MNQKSGGLSSEEKQRRAAAEIARRKVLMAYEAQEEKEVNAAVNFIKKQEKVSEVSLALKTAEKQRSQGVLGVSSAPVLRQVSAEDWKKYHTAWQDYYQKYYSEYYMNAAKEFVAKEQVKQMRANAEKDTVEPKDKPTEKVAETVDERGFKAKIRAKAMEKAKPSRRRVLLTPILMGAAVVLTILFLQYNRLIFARVAAYVSPGDVPPTEISALDPTVTSTKVSSENELIIPKLNVQVPITFGAELSEVMGAMKHGVAHYRINGASAYPGEIGNFVITGHSAGDIYSADQYKFIFSGLERLVEGDLIYVHYNSTRYTYRMVRSEVIEPTEVGKLVYATDKPILTLITCWPLGTSRYRLTVIAEQVSPSYEGAVASDDEDLPVEFEETTLPENEKTFFERVKDWLGL